MFMVHEKLRDHKMDHKVKKSFFLHLLDWIGYFTVSFSKTKIICNYNQQNNLKLNFQNFSSKITQMAEQSWFIKAVG